MFSINTLKFKFCFVLLLCFKVHCKYYIRDDPHPHYEDLVKIDKALASCGPNVPDIREITIKQIQKLFSNGKLTSARLTLCYLNRIKYMNPYLNAVIETNPDAFKIAMKTDYERFLGKKINEHGELHGIPILIKDNIATKDSMQTCSGSLALVGYKPLKEARVVTLLRKSGAVILGKSNLSEFAGFRGTNIPYGWSSRGNQTQNCYFLHVDPYGSSTGSAVAVAANLCAVSLGTETSGSIVTPSDSACLVGLKPSLGCVPSDEVIPIAPNSQDVVGPMTRTVEDAISVYNVISICGTHFKEETAEADKLTSPKKIRIGVLHDPFWDASQVENVNILRQAVAKCEKSTNFIFVENIFVPHNAFNYAYRNAANEKELITLLHEFKTNVNDYLRTVKYEENSNNKDQSSSVRLVQSEEDGPPTLKHVIEFNEKYPSLQGYNQKYLIEADSLDGMTNETYIYAKTTNVNTIRDTLNNIFEKYNLDAIAAPGIATTGNEMYTYFAMAGYPYIIVPVECVKTKPVGIIFHGLMDSDSKLLKLAKDFESCIRGRQPPSFRR